MFKIIDCTRELKDPALDSRLQEEFFDRHGFLEHLLLRTSFDPEHCEDLQKKTGLWSLICPQSFPDEYFSRFQAVSAP
jgi:hypothetical protein